MFKPISITLPEQMIQEIDNVLMNGNFSSRSELFRVLIRFGLHNLKHASVEEIICETSKEKISQGVFVAEQSVVAKSGTEESSSAKTLEDIDPDKIDLEFGIPPDVVRLIEEKVKIEN